MRPKPAFSTTAWASSWEAARTRDDEEAARVLDELEIAYEMEIVSAHRTPDRMFAYAEAAEGAGWR
jgi:phosphoribosylcarboxyaminoimidazole (NCAIR) mutase